MGKPTLTDGSQSEASGAREAGRVQVSRHDEPVGTPPQVLRLFLALRRRSWQRGGAARRPTTCLVHQRVLPGDCSSIRRVSAALR
jgi:hypothetical protein